MKTKARKLFFLLSFVVLLAAAHAAFFQVNAWTDRYPPLKAYEARPGIFVIERSVVNQQPCVLEIVKGSSRTGQDIDLTSSIPRDLVDTLIDEIVPANERGLKIKPLRSKSYIGGGVSHFEREYQNILVLLDGSTQTGTQLITIRWKRPECE